MTRARDAANARAWRVLVAVAFANLVVAAMHFGLAAAAPLLRTELGLDTAQLGVLLAAPPLGLMLGTFAWGELADRVSERGVLAWAFVGFAIVSAAGAWAAAVGSVAGFGISLLLAGIFGSSAHSAGGRAISAAFAPERHGFVLAIRHTAIPIGAAIGGALVPTLVRTVGLDVATATGAVFGLVAAAGVALALPSARRRRGTDHAAVDAAGRSPLREPALWLLASGAACLAFTQLGIGSFLTVQLVDEAGARITVAAGVFTASQLLGAAGRILLGWWSDRVRSRVMMLQGVAVATAALVLVASLASDPLIEAAMLALALVVVTSCNGVVVATAASLAPPGRTGATLGMQTTFNAAACTAAPVILGAVLAGAGWGAFELVLLTVLTIGGASLVLLRRRG